MQYLLHATSLTDCTPLFLMKRHHTPYFPSSLVFSLPPQVFVCVHNHGPCFNKLDPRSTKCVFLGYSQTHKGYRCYFLAFQCYFRIADVTFDESSHISLVFVLLRNTILSLWPVLFRFQPLVLYTFHCSSASNSSSSIRSNIHGQPFPCPSIILTVYGSDNHLLILIALRKGTRSCVTKLSIGNLFLVNLCLHPFSILFPPFLVFPFLRQSRMHSLT